MKNIHILPTDKPSRLSILNSGKLDFGAEIMSSSNSKPQHIYITSNEEIKEGDWTLMFDSFGHLFLSHRPQQYLGIEKGHHLNRGLRKIILTTDKDLIKDGVQSIDDEFLEWFVKNPSCEEVEVDSIETNPDYKSNWENRFTYKIIIPKEEPKQETLEEAAINYRDLKLPDDLYDAFIEGAKWQQERMYSEEEVLEIIRQYDLEEHLITSSKPDIWFKQFKKK